MTSFIITLYIVALTGLSLFGLLGFITLIYYWKHRQDHLTLTDLPPNTADWPRVTIQLPIFNERYVVKRLINAAVSLDYPRDRLEIQVVDDSTDETAAIAIQHVTQLQQQGYHIHHLHRTDRSGYKAGALEAATANAQGEYIAIFDADFLPPPSFLKQTIPYFLADQQLGMIQTRWGHLNQADSPLTAVQAIVMDKHFMLEQTVSHRADMYPKFNGTAGIWRHTCITDAGGWKDDTVCEDLCLSTRAILKGWKFNFLPDVVTPGELPTSMTAYKNQQARWAKGSLQCLLKFGLDIATDHNQPLGSRLYGLISMCGYLAHLFLLIALLLQIPLIYLRYEFSAVFIFFTIAGFGQPLLFIMGQQLIHPNWLSRLRHLPALMVVTLGIGPAVTRAILQIFFQEEHPFIRTPKGQPKQQKAIVRRLDGYRLPFDNIVMVEIGLALYAAVGVVLAVSQRFWEPLFLLILGFIGYSYVAFLSLRE